MSNPNPQLVILGGGFGGLTAVQHLRRAPVDVTLIDKRNFHLFQPLLYQVATGGLSPANIAAPLRAVLKRQQNVQVRLAEATGFDLDRKVVHTSAGAVPFDALIVATGSTHSYFGRADWEALAPGLKTVEDATEMRRRLLLAFETAESLSDPAAREPWLTFVIVGGGPTGVELAGMLAELARHTLKNNFRNIDPARAKIILLEAADRLLLAFPPKLGAKAKAALERMGVTVMHARLTELTAEHIVYEKDGQFFTLPTRTVLWGAGVQASPLGKMLAMATGAELDRQGRVVVEPDLSVKGHPNVFVIGDLAHCKGQDGKPLPGVAPVAMQQGRYVARLIRARLQGRTLPPFCYRDKGSMATIGRGAAVADLGWIKLSGYLAWLAWLFIHLMYLVGFENRLLVFWQWAWAYLTRNRSARLITGDVTYQGAPAVHR
jgi:NADH dehydrogenase